MTVHNMVLSTTEAVNNVGIIKVRQGDKESQKFVAKITENNISKDDIKGYSVFLNSMFEGDIIARDLADFDYGTGVATYTLNESFYQHVGKVSAYFSFEKDGVSDSTANFEYTVIPGACQNIRQGNYIYELEELFKISEDIIKNKDFTILINMIKDVDRKVAEVETEFATVTKLLRADVDKHIKNENNPHKVTPKQVGTLSTAEINTEIAKALSGKVIFEGKPVYLDGDQEYFYDFNAMKVGLFLTWSAYDVGVGPEDSHFQTQVIPKEQINSWPGNSSVIHLGVINTKMRRKMVYANRARVTGNAGNAEGDNREFVLRKITVI